MFNKKDIKSKVFDGVFATGLIIAVLAVLIGLIILSKSVGREGLIVYIITAMVVVGLSLKQSLNNNLSKVSRVWYGIVGGMFAWVVMELGEILGFSSIESEEGFHIFILAGIFTSFLWRYLPIGVRFFVFIFFLNWGGHIVIHLQKYLANSWEFFHTTLLIYSWMALPASLYTVYWIFSKSDTRVQRLYAAGWLYLFMFTFIHMIFIH